LAFSSWSFISRIQNVLWKLGRRRMGNRYSGGLGPISLPLFQGARLGPMVGF
jgi:hypothetical protein